MKLTQNYLMVSCFPVFLFQFCQILHSSKGQLLSSSGNLPLDDPPTFVISSIGYKPDETSPQPPLTIEITVGDPAIPGLDLTGFEYELTWLAKGVDATRNQNTARQLSSTGNDIVEKLAFSSTGTRGYKLGDEIYAQFRVRYYREDVTDSSVEEFSPWSELETSPSYQTGIVVDPTGDIKIRECNMSYSKITLMLRTPINCPTNPESCTLGIRMFFERIAGSLFYWTSRQEVALSSCQISLKNSHLDKKIDVYLKGVCDTIEESDDAILLRFEFTQSTSFWNSYSIPDKKIEISDTLSRWCTYQGDPHMKTFDGLSFSYFGIGDYVLYKNPQRKLEIDARLWPCARQASCICGIAIREGSSVLVLKGCNINKPWQFGVTWKSGSRSFSSIQVWKGLSSNNKYYVFLGSGTQLVITHTYNPEAETSWVNAMLRVPDLQGIHHQGMCGNYDGIADNDLAYGGDGLDHTGDANKFGESWSLPFDEDSWFKRTPTDIGGAQREMCSCGTRAGWWSESKPILGTRCSFREENHFLIITRDSVDITESLQTTSRSRRDTTGLTDTDLNESGGDGEFTLNDFKDYQPIERLTWPTASGLTEVEVYEYCRSIIFDSSGASNCQNVTGKTTRGNNSDLLDNCVKDVQITDQKFWSYSALSTFQLQCDEAILEQHAREIANETETIQSDGTQAVLESLVLVPDDVAITCPGDCSGNGSCVQGGCVCNSGRTGLDCSLRTEQVPVLKGIYFDGLCDVRAHACNVFRVNGFGFANLPGSSLTCHTTGFEIYNASWNESNHQSSSPASLVNLYEVECNLPSHPVSRDKDPYVAGTPAVGMDISVSNDGRKLSNKQTLIVYDGLCLTCRTSRDCNLKNRTCLINGRCYAEGDMHTYETAMFCQPDKSSDQWTGKEEKFPLQEEGKDTTVIIVAGVVAPFFFLVILAIALRFWIVGAHNRGAELDHFSEDNPEFYFHY